MTVKAQKFIGIISHLVKLEETIINRITNDAWSIAYTALWNGTSFSITEKQKAKQAIRDFLLQNQSLELNLEEFVQRVLLARQYINRNPGKYVPIPSEWLSKGNANGFTGTKRWFIKLEEKRKAIPNYKNHWQEFGWSVFQVYGHKSTEKFHEWRSYYAKHHQSLLNLFLATIANNNGWLNGQSVAKM
jgi:hypothetical protein